MYDFAALRFADDENINGKLYWYLAGFPVKEGDEVLAPVGMHDRLQKAAVERTLSAAEESAPYDMHLIKQITARVGARRLVAYGAECFEFGGVRYDNRHYTRFARVLYSASLPPVRTELNAYGVDTVFENPALEDDTIYRAVIGKHGVLLVGGNGREICKILLSLMRGEENALQFLRGVGLYEGELAKLKERLG